MPIDYSTFNAEQLDALRDVALTIKEMEKNAQRKPTEYSTFKYQQYAKIMTEDERDMIIIRQVHLNNDLESYRARAAQLGLGDLKMVKRGYISKEDALGYVFPCFEDKRPVDECFEAKRCKNAENNGARRCTEFLGWQVARYVFVKGESYGQQEIDLKKDLENEPSLKDMKFLTNDKTVVSNSEPDRLVKEAIQHSKKIVEQAEKAYKILTEPLEEFLQFYKTHVSASAFSDIN